MRAASQSVLSRYDKTVKSRRRPETTCAMSLFEGDDDALLYEEVPEDRRASPRDSGGGCLSRDDDGTSLAAASGVSENGISSFSHVNGSDDVSDRHLIWRKNAPFFYSTIVSHLMEWPSLTIDCLGPQWLRNRPFQGRTAELTSRTLKLLLGTCTSGQETNFLWLGDFRYPVPTLEEDLVRCETYAGFIAPKQLGRKLGSNATAGGATSASNGPVFEIKAKLVHVGDVNRAVHAPGSSRLIASQSSTSDVFVFDFCKHPSFPTDLMTSRPQLVLRGHSTEGFGLSWQPLARGSTASVGLLASCGNDGAVCLWDVAQNRASSSMVCGSTGPARTDVALSPGRNVRGKIENDAMATDHPVTSGAAAADRSPPHNSSAVSTSPSTQTSPNERSRGYELHGGSSSDSPSTPSSIRKSQFSGVVAGSSATTVISGSSHSSTQQAPAGVAPSGDAASLSPTSPIVTSPSVRFFARRFDGREASETAQLNDVCFHSKHSAVFATAGSDGVVGVWDCRSSCNALRSQPSTAVASSDVSNEPSLSLVCRPFYESGSSKAPLATRGLDGKENRRAIATAPASSVCFHTHSPHLLAAGTEIGDVILWDVRSTRSPLTHLPFHTDSVNRVRFCPGGSMLLASASEDGVVAIWNVSARGGDEEREINIGGDLGAGRALTSDAKGSVCNEKELMAGTSGDVEEPMKDENERISTNRDDQLDLATVMKCSSASFTGIESFSSKKRNSLPVGTSTNGKSDDEAVRRRHLLFVHGGHRRGGVTDFSWSTHPHSPFLCASVGWDNCLQAWQMSDHILAGAAVP